MVEFNVLKVTMDPVFLSINPSSIIQIYLVMYTLRLCHPSL